MDIQFVGSRYEQRMTHYLCCILYYNWIYYKGIGDDKMLFEWDDHKEKINLAKHGIDFSTAALVF